ncbi:hypothetical protein T01_10513 [Trichinella spiralis]|uniref:Uncharacterized protein n=1 Tax=Trichinella spiralis TaxID=6334 RepID=A0A0V1C1Z4_TRISP|nr:hypothetical protein T01_10513 [Trichinella spiralis]
MYIITTTYTVPSTSVMLYNCPSRNPQPPEKRQPLTPEQYGSIEGFLMNIYYEKKRLAKILPSQVVFTPACQGTRMHCSTSSP